MSSPIYLIANPAAGGATAEKINKAAGFIREKGLRAEVLLTRKTGDGEALAKKALSKGAGLVIAAGGDGTMCEVLNGVAGSGVPMAVVPLGTANVLAKELGIPKDTESAVGLALSGRTHGVSAGRISMGRRMRLFFLMAGIGFDAETVYHLSGRLKGLAGKGAYVLGGIIGLALWRPKTISVSVDGEPFMCTSLIVSKSSRYAGEFLIAPGAKIDDPHLYAFLMHGGRRTDFLKYASGIISGKHMGMKGTTSRRCRVVEVLGEARIQADGDPAGKTPAKIDVAENALNLIF